MYSVKKEDFKNEKSKKNTRRFNCGSNDVGAYNHTRLGRNNKQQLRLHKLHSATTITTSSSSDTIKNYVNGSRVYPDSDPVIRNDRTLVAIRVVAEALGYQVDLVASYSTQNLQPYSDIIEEKLI